MAKIQGAKFREQLRGAIVGQGGGRLAKETLDRVLSHPELESELKKQGVSSAKGILRSIRSGKGGFSSERGEKLVRAVKKVFGPQRLLKLEQSGQKVRLSAAAARQYPRAFVQSMAEKENAPIPAKAEESRIDRLMRRRAYVAQVRKNSSIDARINEKTGRTTLDNLQKDRGKQKRNPKNILLEDSVVLDDASPQPASPTLPRNPRISLSPTSALPRTVFVPGELTQVDKERTGNISEKPGNARSSASRASEVPDLPID